MSTLFFNRVHAATLCAAAVIAIAGCGGGDDESTDTGASGASGASGATGASGPLSDDEFVSQGNAICADLNSQIATLKPPSGDPASIAKFTSEGLAIAEPALQKFQALTPPEDLQAQFDDYLSQAQEQLDKEKELLAAAEAGDVQQVQSLVNEIQAMDNDPAAKELGLDECAKDVAPQG